MEKKQQKLLCRRNFGNKTQLSEGENIPNNILLIEKGDKPIDIPMLFFISNGKDTPHKKTVWRKYLTDYLVDVAISKYIFIEHEHNLYQFAYSDIEKGITEFLNAESYK